MKDLHLGGYHDISESLQELNASNITKSHGMRGAVRNWLSS